MLQQDSNHQSRTTDVVMIEIVFTIHNYIMQLCNYSYLQIHRKSILSNNSAKVDMPSLGYIDCRNAANMYKYYWFAENLQYYSTLRMMPIFSYFSADSQKILWGGILQ